MNLTELLRNTFGKLLEGIASFLNNLGLKPNQVTLFGLVGNILASVFIALGSLQLGGILVLLMGPIDALDGAMARMRGEPTNYGAFVDSVTDRYSELFILGGLMYYYFHRSDALSCFLVFLATAGSVLVSYVRARAESVGFQANSGLLTRVERYLVMAPALLFQRPDIALWIISIFGNLTALQRIWSVRAQAKQQEE